MPRRTHRSRAVRGSGTAGPAARSCGTRRCLHGCNQGAALVNSVCPKGICRNCRSHTPSGKLFRTPPPLVTRRAPAPCQHAAPSLASATHPCSPGRACAGRSPGPDLGIAQPRPGRRQLGASREAAVVKACPGAGQAWPRSMSDTTIPYMATGPCKHRRWRSPGSCRAPHPGWWCPRASSPGPPPWASQQTPQSCGRDTPGGRLANCDLAGMLRPLTRAVLPTASYQWPRPMASCGCAERGDVE